MISTLDQQRADHGDPKRPCAEPTDSCNAFEHQPHSTTMSLTLEQISVRRAPGVHLLCCFAVTIPALAEDLKVNPDNGVNAFTTIFDAPLGERITTISSSVACDISYDPPLPRLPHTLRSSTGTPTGSAPNTQTAGSAECRPPKWSLKRMRSTLDSLCQPDQSIAQQQLRRSCQSQKGEGR
jgi:hypothetical protein